MELMEDPACLKVCEKTGWTMHVVKGLKEIFDAMDLDNNGTISKKEIVEGKDDLAGKILNRTGVNWLWNFKHLDENNDNRLTFEEFCVTFETDEDTIKLAEKMGFKPMQVISIKSMFDKMDLDENGTVEWKEIKEKKNHIAKFILQNTGISWG